MINFPSFLCKEISLALIQRSSLLCSLLGCLQSIGAMRRGAGSSAGETGAWSPNMGKAPAAPHRPPPPPASRQPVASVRVKSYSCKNIYGWLSPATAYKQVFCKNSVCKAEAVKWFSAFSLWKAGWLFCSLPGTEIWTLQQR